MTGEPYDAVLIHSVGGPEEPAQVGPFIERLFHGRRLPDEVRETVQSRYEAIGGVSPVNAEDRALKAALEKELAAHGIRLPVYLGNRHAPPFVGETLREMKAAGMKRFLVFVNAAFSCYATCRQFREELERELRGLGPGAPAFDKVRFFYNHPVFIDVIIARWREALARIPRERREGQVTLFTAPSIPLHMARWCDYAMQLMEACRLVTMSLRIPRWKLAYQGHVGASHFFSLEPDILDVLFELHGREVLDVIVVPVGYMHDDLDIAYGLDREAKDVSVELGINLVRTATLGTHPLYVGLIRELVQERLDPSLPRRAVGSKGPYHDDCPPDCCRSGA